jgi:hypothetical protein
LYSAIRSAPSYWNRVVDPSTVSWGLSSGSYDIVTLDGALVSRFSEL